MTIETQLQRHEDDNHNLKVGTRGDFIVGGCFDVPVRLFSIHHVLNIMAERAADESDNDGANTLWLMAKLVEEVSDIFHHARTATVVRSVDSGRVDVEITGRTKQPNAGNSEAVRAAFQSFLARLNSQK